jgi:hypothetical protein
MSSATQTAEEEALKQLGAVKSSYALIDLAAKQIENRILLNDEVLNDNPASFSNIFLENFGRLGSQSFYEQMMYKNEMLPATAIKLRSLINKLRADDIPKIYAYPAHMTFVLGYNYDRLIELAKANGNKIVINKECRFSMEEQEDFVLDHNIIIKLVNPDTKYQNLYAIYDVSDKINLNSTLTEVNNIYITSQVFMVDGIKYFGMFVNGRQMKRTISHIIVTSDNPDFQLNYDDQLFGFEVAYKSINSDSYVFKNGMFDGNLTANGYNFSIDNEEKTIDFTFNRNPTYWSPRIGDEFDITVYTTKGSKGNFKVPDMFSLYNQANFEYFQNRDIPEQNAVVFTTPIISIKDAGATGGRDALSFEQLRELVEERGSNSTILAPGDLERKAESLGFSVKKIRSDVRCLEYRASGTLENYPSIISSRDSVITFDFEDLPLNLEVSNRMINPKMVFEFDANTKYCKYLKNPESYNEYFELFKINAKKEFSFPYHIRFISSNEINATVFNMNRDNDLYNLNFEFYNNNTSFESSILNLIVNRNTITENINDIPKKGNIAHASGYYDFSFQVTTSDIVIANLLDDDLDKKISKYKVVISDGNKEYLVESHIYPEEIDADNNLVTVHAYIRTDDAINNSNNLIVRDYSIEPIPYIQNPIEYYFLPDKISLKIYVIEKSESENVVTKYDNVLTDAEKQDLYFVSTVYSASDIVLFENYSDYFNLPSDVTISQKEYSHYESDVYKLYEEDEFLLDNNGDYIKDIVKLESNGTTIYTEVFKVLHKKDSYVYKTNEEMKPEHLAKPIAILNETTEINILQNYSKSELANMIKFDLALLSNEELITYLKRFLNLDYEIITEYNNDTAYNFLVDGSGHILTDTIKNNLQNKLNEYRENYKVLIHKAGDVDPNSALVKDESYSAIIKKVPMFDRVYAAGYEGYKKIFDSYESLVSDIKSLQRVKPDGATISLGIKNTSGIGEYEIFNMNTSTWQAIDDISLSFDIGVKYNSDVSDENIQYNNNIIIETIRDYINEFDEISFGINTIFELVKEKLPSIEYMIIYKINQYPASEVQSIRKKGGNSIVSDKLCVKEVIDIDNTDLNNKSVKFKPDITVKIIP